MNLSSSLCKGSERKDLKDSKSYRLSKQHSNPVSSCLPRPSLLHMFLFTLSGERRYHTKRLTWWHRQGQEIQVSCLACSLHLSLQRKDKKPSYKQGCKSYMEHSDLQQPACLCIFWLSLLCDSSALPVRTRVVAPQTLVCPAAAALTAGSLRSGIPWILWIPSSQPAQVRPARGAPVLHEDKEGFGPQRVSHIDPPPFQKLRRCSITRLCMVS